MIVNSTFFVTRKCNLNCSYCQVKNKKMSELSISEKEDALLVMKKLGVGINILFGGEPLMLGSGLVELVEFMNNNNIPYAISSNSTKTLLDKFKQDLIDVGLKNWSVSLDTLKIDKNINKDIRKKSNEALDALDWFKRNGVPDLHATITVTRKNIDEVKTIVSILSGMGIWSEVTPVHWSKGKLYDMFPVKNKVDYLQESDRPKIEKMT